MPLKSRAIVWSKLQIDYACFSSDSLLSWKPSLDPVAADYAVFTTNSNKKVQYLVQLSMELTSNIRSLVCRGCYDGTSNELSGQIFSFYCFQGIITRNDIYLTTECLIHIRVFEENNFSTVVDSDTGVQRCRKEKSVKNLKILIFFYTIVGIVKRDIETHNRFM